MSKLHTFLINNNFYLDESIVSLVENKLKTKKKSIFIEGQPEAKTQLTYS